MKGLALSLPTSTSLVLVVRCTAKPITAPARPVPISKNIGTPATNSAHDIPIIPSPAPILPLAVWQADKTTISAVRLSFINSQVSNIPSCRLSSFERERMMREYIGLRSSSIAWVAKCRSLYLSASFFTSSSVALSPMSTLLRLRP